MYAVMAARQLQNDDKDRHKFILSNRNTEATGRKTII